MALAQVQAAPLRICMFDQDYENVSFLHGEAPGQYLVRKAVEAQGDSVIFEPLPGKRCAILTAAGEFDAALGPAWNPIFATTMRFPMVGATPNPEMRVGETTIRLVRRKGGSANWTGTRFERLDGHIAIVAGSETTKSLLMEHGATVYEAKTVEQVLKMVSFERVPMAALRQMDLYHTLTSLEDKDKLEVLPPFKSGALYLGVSTQQYNKHPEYFDAIWRKIGALRAQHDWPAIYNDLIRHHAPRPPVP